MVSGVVHFEATGAQYCRAVHGHGCWGHAVDSMQWPTHKQATLLQSPKERLQWSSTRSDPGRACWACRQTVPGSAPVHLPDSYFACSAHLKLPTLLAVGGYSCLAWACCCRQSSTGTIVRCCCVCYGCVSCCAVPYAVAGGELSPVQVLLCWAAGGGCWCLQGKVSAAGQWHTVHFQHKAPTELQHKSATRMKHTQCSSTDNS
jgi:hypothetical protein